MLGCFVGALVWLARALRLPAPAALALGALAPLFHPWRENVARGQMYALVLLLAVGSAALMIRGGGRRARAAASGAARCWAGWALPNSTTRRCCCCPLWHGPGATLAAAVGVAGGRGGRSPDLVGRRALGERDPRRVGLAGAAGNRGHGLSDAERAAGPPAALRCAVEPRARAAGAGAPGPAVVGARGGARRRERVDGAAGGDRADARTPAEAMLLARAGRDLAP